MPTTQGFGVLLMLMMVGGIAYAYVRKGAKIEPDPARNTEDWPRTTLGGS